MTVPTRRERCIGCGAEVPAEDGPTHRYLESAPGCWRLYGEVLAREYEKPAYWPVHQLTVDAYAVQHPGRKSAQTIQSAAIHLVRLYLQLECDVEENALLPVTRAIAQRKGQLMWLNPPESRGPLTVLDIHAAAGPEDHINRVRAWAGQAWSAWASHHDPVRRWANGDFGAQVKSVRERPQRS